jgi:hypothetical protein
MKHFFWAFVIVAICNLPIQSAHSKALTCTNDEDDAASLLLEKANDLQDIYYATLKYPGCSFGGGVSEEIDDRVAKVLLHNWLGTINYVTSSHKHLSIATLLVRYRLNETDDPDDLATIRSKASTNCPARARKFCKRIIESVDSAFPDRKPTGNFSEIR